MPHLSQILGSDKRNADLVSQRFNKNGFAGSRSSRKENTHGNGHQVASFEVKGDVAYVPLIFLKRADSLQSPWRLYDLEFTECRFPFGFIRIGDFDGRNPVGFGPQSGRDCAQGVGYENYDIAEPFNYLASRPYEKRNKGIAVAILIMCRFGGRARLRVFHNNREKRLVFVIVSVA